MSLLKFLKNPQVLLSIPVIILLFVLTNLHLSIGWHLTIATTFLIIYGYKFSLKENANFIDVIRLLLYFVWLTVITLSGFIDFHLYHLLYLSSWSLICISYFASGVIFIWSKFKEKYIYMKTFNFALIVIQSLLLIGIGLWALTQKVEADRQKELAVAAEKKAKISEQKAKESEHLAQVEKMKAITEQKKLLELLQQCESKR